MTISFYSYVINVVLGKDDAYIGLSDGQREGRLVFIDGVVANSRNVGWHTGEPNGGRNENCVHINLIAFPQNTANDFPSHLAIHALCEKTVSPTC